LPASASPRDLSDLPRAGTSVQDHGHRFDRLFPTDFAQTLCGKAGSTGFCAGSGCGHRLPSQACFRIQRILTAVGAARAPAEDPRRGCASGEVRLDADGGTCEWHFEENPVKNYRGVFEGYFEWALYILQDICRSSAYVLHLPGKWSASRQSPGANSCQTIQCALCRPGVRASTF